ncbi:MAG: hypothetical protein BWY11_00802 [Firmicutes bacterium ADurb.Bin182]|nr:MAG: hypothetical protein BWY11_00802 [Firmicutes bacterium ADurb.Bin182]
MRYQGIEYCIKNVPELDPDFIPFGAWMDEYEKRACKPFAVAVEAADGRIVVHRSSIIGGKEHAEADYVYMDRLVKFLLWSAGGFRVYLCGAPENAERISKSYAQAGERQFDAQLMKDVYGKDFEVIVCGYGECPKERTSPVSVGGHLDGCRIGFDAGGSDRKVSAVINGEPVYSEEVAWNPKEQTDPQYHYNEIVAAFRTAASKMPRVDAIGISSAGVIIKNKPMVSSLFMKVPREKREFVIDIFQNAAKQIGDVPLAAANDGDVTALAGAMSLGEGAVMGIAMGTSEAVGYVNEDGKILGWLNELAFAPVDLNETAPVDEWSGDRGAGCKYFSQDAVIRLAQKAGILLSDSLTPAQKLLEVQKLAEGGNTGAIRIFKTIGAYLAHTIPLYSKFYDIRYLLVLGRVLSGRGGDIIVSECCRILKEEYPELSKRMKVMLPDEKTRRIGQSVAAASLPE